MIRGDGDAGRHRRRRAHRRGPRSRGSSAFSRRSTCARRSTAAGSAPATTGSGPRPCSRRASTSTSAIRAGAALQLPPRCRVDRGGEGRAISPSSASTSATAATLERDRPYLIPLRERLDAPGRRPRAHEPEELDRPPRRLHPRDHRPQPPLRRDPRRLPRAASTSRSSRARSRSTSAAGWRSTSSGSRPAATRASTTPSSSPCTSSSRSSTSTRTRCASRSWDLGRPLPERRPRRRPGRAGRRLPGEEEQPPDRPRARSASYRWTDFWEPVYPEAGLADRARAGDLLPAALGRGLSASRPPTRPR